MKNLVLISLIILSVNGFAQKTNEWKTKFNNEKILISYQYYNCEYSEQFNEESVLIRIENKTNDPLTISWKTEMWYDEKCINCNNQSIEYINSINIQEKEIITASCNTHSELKIFSKFTEKLENMPGVNKITKLTNFELQNIEIK